MTESTGADGIQTIDVQEDEELCTALFCDECDETFPWVATVLPNYCPMCGQFSRPKLIPPEFVKVKEKSDD